MVRISRASRVHASRGFSLVELLVVIALIVLLIALILPSMGRAREQARITLCASGLRQWGMVYTNYAGTYREFLGGVVSWELRDCFTNTNLSYGPDNVAPWSGTWYQQSPWNRSTVELARMGLSAESPTRRITRCPSRLSSDYSAPVADSWSSGGLENPGSLIYVDYWVFAGFSNDPASAGWGTTFSGWGHRLGYFADVNRRGPVTRLSERRSLRALLAMDRHWTINTNNTYYYNDVGNLSNHRTFNNYNTTAYPYPLASGSNCLLLDMSVQWTTYNQSTLTQNYIYAQDWYRWFYVGESLRRP
jgi:prepilin-type N-terminal cleavage/methylation domain-containing protein